MRYGFAATVVELHVLQFFFCFKTVGFGGLQPALFLLHGLAGTELVFHRHEIHAVALPLLLFPAGPANTQLLQHAAVELLELVFRTFVNNDPIRAAADDFLHRHLPGAEHTLPEQRHPQGSHHQGGEFAGLDVESEAQNPTQLLAGFGDHLAVDHSAVALGIEVFAERVGGIHQNHIPHLTDPIQRHPARQAWKKAGERVIAQSNRHHFAAVDINDHLSHHAEAATGVTGDHLGAHQFGSQPETITGHASGEGVSG